MSQRTHEDIRLQVVNFLVRLYRELVEEGYKIAMKSGREEEARRLGHLLEVLTESSSESLPLLMSQEVKVGGGRWRVDMLVGRGAVFEIKRTVEEFDDAVYTAVTRYLKTPELANVEYFVTTNYEKWSIYQVKRKGSEVRLEPIAEKIPLVQARDLVKSYILTNALGKLPAHTEVIKTLFTPRIQRERENVWVKKMKEVFTRLCKTCEGERCEVQCNPASIGALYEAYKQITKTLYGEANEEFFVDLFIRHTVMHMVVLASLAVALGKRGDPVDMCSGMTLDIDIALPYLNWWRLPVVENGFEEEKRIIEDVASDIVQRAELIDWDSGGTEDVFRLLYEYLVDEGTRRRLGEYYTPLWLVELGLKEFELRGKTVVDPFCGSGTFLVTAFHRKIDEGESPEEAYKSLIGFDINPLAVAVARAELVLAYRRQTGADPPEPPRIYHIDTLAAWFAERGFRNPSETPLTYDLANKLIQLVRFEIQISDFQHIVDIEKHLTDILHQAYITCKGRERDERCLSNNIEAYMKRRIERISDPLRAIFQRMIELGLPNDFTKLINKYGGNSIWGLVFASLYVPMLLQRIQPPDIIATNPPWIHISEFRAPYSNRLRDTLLTFAREAGVRAGQVVSGSDVATAALAKAIESVREGVVFVMNREQVFQHGSSALAGVVAAYAVLRKWNGALKLIDIDFDAFGHGIYPALVIAKRGQGTELYIAKVEGHASKSSRLESVNIRLEKLPISYENYVEPGLLYFSEEESTERIAVKFAVDEVIRMGQFIRGLFGGERRREKKAYAGIIVDSFEDKGEKVVFKLYNMSKPLEAPKELLEKHGIGVYNLIYVGEIYPFHVCRLYQVLLSSRGDEELRNFLKEVENYNSPNIPTVDINRLRQLINEVTQGNSLRTFTSGKFYVVYRADRAFTAGVIEGDESYVPYSNVAAVACKSKEQAYYYSAVLNYLAYKVKSSKRVFSHHQYAKPLLAIILLGLSWRDVREDVRNEVAKLAEELSNLLQNRCNVFNKFSNMTQALEYVANYDQFKQIVKLLDSVVRKEYWELALDLVSSRGGKDTRKHAQD